MDTKIENVKQMRVVFTEEERKCLIKAKTICEHVYREARQENLNDVRVVWSDIIVPNSYEIDQNTFAGVAFNIVEILGGQSQE